MAYVDGYVLPIPKKKLQFYRRIAQKAGKIWREHGALEYKECAGDDLKNNWGAQFPKLFKTTPTETIIFAFVTYKNRAHRDRVNAKVMKDERMHKMMDPKDPIFDVKRMAYGGFTTIVDL
jgi:uncharacterized protein YbaA (DUF1428 family)